MKVAVLFFSVMATVPATGHGRTTLGASIKKRLGTWAKPVRFYKSPNGTTRIVHLGIYKGRRVVKQLYTQRPDGTIHHREVRFRRMLGNAVKDVKTSVQKPGEKAMTRTQSFGRSIEDGYAEHHDKGGSYRPINRRGYYGLQALESPLSPVRMLLGFLRLYAGEGPSSSVPLRKVPAPLFNATRKAYYPVGEHPLAKFK